MSLHDILLQVWTQTVRDTVHEAGIGSQIVKLASLKAASYDTGLSPSA